MKTIKKISLIVLILGLVCSLTACCKHEYTDATCIKPKTCSLCEKTSGEPNEENHYWEDSTCTSPQICNWCNVTMGEPLGHNYIDGYCFSCYERDPNYVDLYNLGFIDTYGMNVWVDVQGYNYGENIVKIQGSEIDFYNFNGRYYQTSVVSIRQLEEKGTSILNSLDYGSALVYNIVSNDVITFSGGPTGTVTIEDRVVSGDSKLVMKTYFDTYWDDEECWFVPADLLDFSTIKLYEENNYGKIYSINFK